jgi:hypothetical protein
LRQTLKSDADGTPSPRRTMDGAAQLRAGD